MATDKKITELPVAETITASDISLLVSDGTDHQFAIGQLLQYLNSNLVTGATVTFGTVLPLNALGKNGDVFLKTDTGQIAQKISGSWAIVYQLPEANGADGTVLYGAGVPGAGIGKNSDTYIDTLTGIFYLKALSNWSQVFSMQSGPQGPKGNKGDPGPTGLDGRTILSGTSNPSNQTTGTNGDFYLNTTSLVLFGPKTDGAWGSGTTIAGPAGSQGEAGPPGPAGVAGPKGDKGDDGDAGPAGPKGDTGDTGPAGPKGDKGDTGEAGGQGATGSAGVPGPKGDKGDTGAAGPQGSAGPQGATGPAGPSGAGVPTGGTTGQVLAKASNSNYDNLWIDQVSGISQSVSFPSDISGLAHDFDFGVLDNVIYAGTTKKISQIFDTVGNVASTQSNSANQPLLRLDGGANNHSFAAFDGTQWLSGPLLNVTVEGTIILVRKQGGQFSDGRIQSIFHQGNDNANGYGYATFLSGADIPGISKYVGGYISTASQLNTDIPAQVSSIWEGFTMTFKKSDATRFSIYDILTSSHAFAGSASWGVDPTTKHSIGSGAQSNFIGGIQRILIYNRKLSINEIDRINTHLIDKYKLIKPKRIVFIGDSITAPNLTGGNYPEYVYKTLYQDNLLSFSNRALNGETSSGILSRLSSQVLAGVNQSTTNVFCLLIGHNDLNGNLFANVVSICQQCQSAGYKVIALTVLPSTAYTTSTLNNLINDKIRNNWGQFADALVDIAILPNALDPTNTTFYSDGTHPTVTLATDIANIVKPTITRLLGI